MALLDTIKMIEDRRDRVMNRRQSRMAEGESPIGMPIDPMQLRRAMSRMQDIYKKNRQKIMEDRDKRMRMAQAVQKAMAEQEAAEKGQQQAPAQPQQAPAQPMQPQGLLGGMGAPQQQNAPQQPQGQGIMGMPQAPNKTAMAVPP